MEFFGFTSPIEISISLDHSHERKELELGKNKGLVPIYTADESVSGQVILKTKDGRVLSHEGLRIQFLGRLEMLYDRSGGSDFVSSALDLVGPQAEVNSGQSYAFEFKDIKKPYESYRGINVRLQYCLKVILTRRRQANLTKERDIWVHLFTPPKPPTQPVKMEVGIEDALHIEFEYNKASYHLQDVILGKIYFLLVRIKIRRMELSIIRRETAGHGGQQYNETETMTKFEIMDGSPVRGEAIPIRLYLSGFDLTPTFEDVAKKFSTRYYLNLVLFDEEVGHRRRRVMANQNRRYFKQHVSALAMRRFGSLGDHSL